MGVMIPTLLDAQAAADILGVSTRHLEYLRAEGKGPEYVRLGRRSVRYPLDDLLAWIRECKEAG